MANVYVCVSVLAQYLVQHVACLLHNARGKISYTTYVIWEITLTTVPCMQSLIFLLTLDFLLFFDQKSMKLVKSEITKLSKRVTKVW